MRYDITYTESWTQKCPTCGDDVILRRPPNEPHKELTGICENCNGDLVGFIHVGIHEPRHYVIDLNLDRSWL